MSKEAEDIVRQWAEIKEMEQTIKKIQKLAQPKPRAKPKKKPKRK